MKEEEVRISRLRMEGGTAGEERLPPGGRRDLEKLSFTFT